MSFETLIRNQAVTGMKRLNKSVKNLESNQAHPIESREGTVSSPPTTGEINSIFDTPTNIGQDFIGLIIDTVNSLEWLVWTDGTSWYVVSSGNVASTARVYNSANISIANNTPTFVSFDSEQYDTDSYHDTAVNNTRLTVPSAGYYQVWAMMEFDNNGAGIRYLAINASTDGIIANQIRQALTGNTTTLNLSTTYNMSTGDYFEALVVQKSGGPLDLLKNGFASPFFGIAKIN